MVKLTGRMYFRQGYTPVRLFMRVTIVLRSSQPLGPPLVECHLPTASYGRIQLELKRKCTLSVGIGLLHKLYRGPLKTNDVVTIPQVGWRYK